MLDIAEAMSDFDLFGPFFPGASWNGWRAVLKGAFGLAAQMTDDEREFFRTVAEREPPQRRVREAWFVVGRGGGKDSVASVIAAHAAAMFDQQHRLRPGERVLVMNLACDRPQAAIVLNYTRAFFTNIPMLAALMTREVASGFELSNGVDIAISTNSFRNVRGRSILCAIFDETAFWRDETSSNPDEEVARAVAPGLARMPGSILIGISSPYRKAGLLYRKFREHFGRDDDDILVIRAPSIALNPTLDRGIIARELQEDPAAARAEWLAEFRDDIAGWASRELIEAAVDRGVVVRPPVPGVSYYAGVDSSGGVRDSYTAAVAHNEDGVAVLDCIVEIRAPFDPIAATKQIADVIRSYRLRTCTGDKYSASWIISAMADCGVTYAHSERDRSAIYLDALPLFTSGRARLLDNQRLVSQFASLERRTSPIGKDRVDHGQRGADDVCNSAALAMVLAVSDDDCLHHWLGAAGLLPHQRPALPPELPPIYALDLIHEREGLWNPTKQCWSDGTPPALNSRIIELATNKPLFMGR